MGLILVALLVPLVLGALMAYAILRVALSLVRLIFVCALGLASLGRRA